MRRTFKINKFYVIFINKLKIMRKIVRLTERDLSRIVRRVISEDNSNILMTMDEQTMVDDEIYDQVENLMGGYGDKNIKKELSGKWTLTFKDSPIDGGRVVKNGDAVLDFYVNGRKEFTHIGRYRHFTDFPKSGNFKIITTMYNHSEAGPTPRYKIDIMK